MHLLQKAVLLYSFIYNFVFSVFYLSTPCLKKFTCIRKGWNEVDIDMCVHRDICMFDVIMDGWVGEWSFSYIS